MLHSINYCMCVFLKFICIYFFLYYRGPCVRKLFTGLIMYLPSQNKEHCIVLYCNPAQGVRNPANDWNPKSKFLRWFFPCWRGFSPVFSSRKNPTLPSFNSIQNSRTRLNEFLRTPKGLQQSRDFLINFSCFRFLMETKIVTPLCITS